MRPLTSLTHQTNCSSTIAAAHVSSTCPPESDGATSDSSASADRPRLLVLAPSACGCAMHLGRAAEQLKAHLRSPVTTHVLDIGAGRPAQGVAVSLERRCEGSRDAWERLASGCTNADGRVGDLLPPGGHMDAGTYRITFATQAYAAATGRDQGSCREAARTWIAPGQEQQHFHVPLTFSPFGYSTYRGS